MGMGEDVRETEQRVLQLREQLYLLMDEYGVNHLEVLEFSRALDKLILELL